MDDTGWGAQSEGSWVERFNMEDPGLEGARLGENLATGPAEMALFLPLCQHRQFHQKKPGHQTAKEAKGLDA